MRYVSLTALLLTSACAVGPDYQRPSISIPDFFKEAKSSTSEPKSATPVAEKDASPENSPAEPQPKLVVAEAVQPPSDTAKPAEQKAVTDEVLSPATLHKPQFSTVVLTKFSDQGSASLPAPATSADVTTATAPAVLTPVAEAKPVQPVEAPAKVTPVVDSSPIQSAETIAAVESPVGASDADAKPSQSVDAPIAVAAEATPVADTKSAQPKDASVAVTPTIAVAEEKPAQDIPDAVKQLQPAHPQEAVMRGQWWSVFADPALNALEEQVASHNQTVQASEAAFHQARALVAENRAAFFPTISGDATVSRSKAAQSSAYKVNSSVRDSYNASLGASWVPDFWGRVRRQMEAGDATAEASAANLAVATLSAQTELATDYLSLRIADEQKRLLERTVAAYSKSLFITENQYKAGIVSRSDVLQAKVQLDNAQAQLADIGVQRAQYEHAIAMLIGKAPAAFSLAAADVVPALPDTPAVVPSQLMERRPDIAASERSMIAANAQIGVAEAAYFPSITLAASGGYGSSALAQWFDLPSRFWSVGPSLAETLFDAGLRSAQTEAAIASYDQTVANYRQTVLKAFQEVEDNLASLHILAEESKVLESAVQDANASAEISMNQYKAGTVSYLSVATTQAASLNAQISALNVRKQRLLAAATLIENVGGGWNVAELSNPIVLQSKTTPISILPPSVGTP